MTQNHETVEALTIVDLLRRASIPVTTVSIEESIQVTSSLGITVLADALYSDCTYTDMEALILPGGPGHMNLYHHTELASLIVETHAKKTLVAAICAAPKVLASLGIQVKSTIYPSMTDSVPHYMNTSVCVDDCVITGNALGASIPFSLAIITYLRDKDTAQFVADGIVYPPSSAK
ncbi:MAG: DJ-1/PfpI family protein [Eubacteriales bacterium]